MAVKLGIFAWLDGSHSVDGRSPAPREKPDFLMISL